MFSKVLVANRGEIAVRVIRALRELDVASVAVFSQADRDALHVRMADEAIEIGPAPPAESYLRQDAIIEAATETGAEAVHPGYGFLSENADFATACAKAKLTFIGPTPEAMGQLGDKVAARALAIKEGVTVAQGSQGALTDAKEAAEVAKTVGYPVLLKAAAGGGGMGMRVVRNAAEMEPLFASAQEQAEKAFGNGAMFLERYLEAPRHIEVQIVGDADGNPVHLYERDCSVQRRHQKLLEEGPSPGITPKERETVTEMAVTLARAGNYTNAGTMEFLYQDGTFHFNEVNTRLQVEHPVTELITGVDLVQAQLRVAAGDDLDIRQDDVQIRGHALECRINAEDPTRGFMPSPGPVAELDLPQGPGVRIDTMLTPGWTVPGTYDSLVAKLLTWAPTREANLRRMQSALADLTIKGFPTNAPFHQHVVRHPEFAAGTHTTRFLEKSGILETMEREAAHLNQRAAAVVAALAQSPQGGLGTLALRHTMPPRRRPQ